MKILHTISSVDPSWGGPIEGIKQLASSLSESPVPATVEIVSLDSPDAPFLKSFPLPLYPLGPSRFHYHYNERLVPWLRANAQRYDIVIVNGIWQFHSFGVWRALRNSSIPYVVFTHGMLSPWFKRKYPLKHLKKWLYWPWAEYRVLRDAKAVLFTSDEERLLARRSFWLYSVRERVSSYGTAAPVGNPATDTLTFFERFSSLRGKRIVLFMGRLHEIKGCDLALYAFADQCGSDATLHLVFCGPDSYGVQPKLERLSAELGIAERVTWTGMVDGDLKRGAFCSADVLLLPSHQENFGMVVAEALARSLPVLISNKVNIWREIKADGAGFVEDDDRSGASALLRRWISLPESDRTAMRSRARLSFESRFEIGIARANLIGILEEIANAAKPTNVLAQTIEVNLE